MVGEGGGGGGDFGSLGTPIDIVDKIGSYRVVCLSIFKVRVSRFGIFIHRKAIS